MSGERVAIVCGGRHYRGLIPHRAVLASALGAYNITHVLHGDCKGADRWAGEVAARLGYGVRKMPAEWSKYGPAAGPIRNREMLAVSPVVLIAMPGGKGTRDIVQRAIDARIDVVQFHVGAPMETPG